MKINKAAIGLLFLSFFASADFCLAQDNEKTPIAVLAEKVYMLDHVIEGKVVAHDFILKNQGTADLIIEKVESG